MPLLHALGVADQQPLAHPPPRNAAGVGSRLLTVAVKAVGGALLIWNDIATDHAALRISRARAAIAWGVSPTRSASVGTEASSMKASGMPTRASGLTMPAS